MSCVWANSKVVGETQLSSDENMSHAHSMLDKKVYKHTLVICNACWAFLGNNFSRTHLNIALCVHLISWTEFSIKTYSSYLMKAHFTYKNTCSIARWYHAGVNEVEFWMLSFTLPSVLVLLSYVLGFKTPQFRKNLH
jgi:hypothetical protein